MPTEEEEEKGVVVPLTNTKDDVTANEQENVHQGQGYPIDKGWAWVTVAACFGVSALVVGGIKSFGVLLIDLTRRLDAPISVITSTQSIAGFLHLGLAPFANALSNRFSHRSVVFTGGMFISIGLISTAFVTSIGALFVTYGIITGIGFGITLGPSLVCMGLHFNKRRALANGLSASGAGAGSFAIPNLIRFLQLEYGFNGCLLILGALALNTCVCACLFRPRTFWSEKRKCERRSESNEEDKTENGNCLCKETINIQHNHKSIHTSIGNIVKYETPNRKIPLQNNIKFSSQPNLTLHNSGNRVNSSSAIYPSLESLCVLTLNERNTKCTKQKSKILSILDLTLLKNPIFLLINTSIWFGIFGHHVVFNCLPSLCVEFGMSDKDAALVVSIVGFSDLLGRILGGWLADLKYFQRRTVFQISMIFFGGCMFITPHVNSLIGMCIMGAFIGVTTGGYIGTQVSVLADAFGIERLSSSLGFTFFCASLALLASPFLSGLIKDISGSWTNSIRLGAASGVLGSFMLFLLPIVQRKSRQSKDKDLMVVEITSK